MALAPLHPHRVGAASADLACGHSNFTLNNLIACLVAADILQLIGLKSFRAAGVLLVRGERGGCEMGWWGGRCW